MLKQIYLAFFLLFSIGLYGQNDAIVTEEILVRGNCGMCKENIENAVQKERTAQGTWNIETKVLKVSFDSSKTSFDRIMKRVTEAGYDNEMYTADDRDYRELAACCLYDRETSWENIQDSEGTHFDDDHQAQDSQDHEKPTEVQVADSDEQISNDESVEDDYSWLAEDAIALNTISTVGNKAATALDGKSAGLTFNIDSKELLKAACCNLSESFETNATVDVNYSNAVTGTKQIKMLGLDQKYTLMSKELLPEIRGLASAYGMNFIPGRWIEAIQLTKGGSTVSNGYESISGQINTELFKTENRHKTAINIFANTHSRIEGNVVHADTLNSNWAHSVLAHANTTLERQDENNDGFMDTPIGKQLNFTYLLNYNDLNDSGFGSHFGVNFLNDQRLAGQMNFRESQHKLGDDIYGVGIDISRFQIWNKTGYIFKNKPYQSLGWMNQYTYHDQNSYFGTSLYNGIERSFYSNLIFESIFGNTNHKYKTGLSFLHDEFDEIYRTDRYERTETVPGAFFEYTFTGDKLTAVLGSRVDFHNLVGTHFTPRVNLKYDLFPKTTLRASGGRGFRTANVFSEAQSYLASNRLIEIMDDGGDIYGLDAEVAWNYGLSLHQEFRVFGNRSNIIADYFITDFENQILPDLDHSTNSILFYNMKGKSYARAFQVQWDFQPIRRLEARLAYKNYQTQADYLDGAKELAFTPEHRGFVNLAYSTFRTAQGSQWSFDSTLQWIGEQRIPSTLNNPLEFQSPEYSDSYFVLNAQVARQLNDKIRIYAGAENILSYTQDNPIIDAANPFGNYFDGGLVWAPIMPASFYLGFDIDF